MATTAWPCSTRLTGASLLTEIRTTDPVEGAADWIFAGDGPDTVLGGSGADVIDAGSDAGADVVVGDNGFGLFDIAAGTSVLTEIRTTDPDHGGDDVIVAGDGPDTVLGGSGADLIDAGTDGARDVVVGDNGEAFFDIVNDMSVLARIASTDPSVGGDDEIVVGDGDDVVIAGVGTDYVNYMPVAGGCSGAGWQRRRRRCDRRRQRPGNLRHGDRCLTIDRDPHDGP